jgi:hypothetical protein
MIPNGLEPWMPMGVSHYIKCPVLTFFLTYLTSPSHFPILSLGDLPSLSNKPHKSIFGGNLLLKERERERERERWNHM